MEFTVPLKKKKKKLILLGGLLRTATYTVVSI
jgi:hypothetical protein